MTVKKIKLAKPQQLFKIFHIPSGEYAVSATVYGTNSRHNTPHLFTSKKGRTWKQYAAMLANWQYMKKQFNEFNNSKLIHDYEVHIFELVLGEVCNDESMAEDIAIKNAKYHQRQLQREKSRLEWQIKEAKKNMQSASKSLPNIEAQLQSVNDKLKQFNTL